MNTSTTLRSAFITAFILGCVIIIPVGTLGFHMPKLWLLSIAAVLGMLCILVTKNSATPLLHKTWTGSMLLLYIAIIGCSLLWAHAPMVSITGLPPRFDGVLAHGVYFLLAYIALALSNNKPNYKIWISNALCCIGSILTLYGLLQILHIDPLQSHWDSDIFLGRIFSLSGQPNAFAQSILLTLPFLALWSTTQCSWKRWIGYCLCTGAIVSVFATASRAGLVGLATGCLILCSTNKNGLTFLQKNIATKLAVFLSIVVLVIIGGTSLNNRFTSEYERGRSLNARSIIAETSIELIQKNPFGYGLESLLLLSSSLIPKDIYEYESLTTEIDRAHSKPLDLLLTLGVLGFVAFYGFLILLCMHVWNHRKDPLALACLIAILQLQASLLIDFESTGTQALFWAVVGLSLSYVPLQHTQKKLTPCVLLVGSLCLAVSTSLWMQARLDMERGDRSYRNGNIEQSLVAYTQAIHTFAYDRELLIHAIETGIIRLQSEQSEALQKQTETWLQKLHTLTNRNDGTAYALEGWLATVLDNPERRTLAFEQALALKPNNITIRRILQYAYSLKPETQAEYNNATQAIIDLLPTNWNNPDTERGRILAKESPWLKDLY